MNIKTFRAAAVCLGSLLSAGVTGKPAIAQMMDSVKVTLPYPATVGTTNLAAGEYTITDMSGVSGSGVVRIRSGAGSTVTALVSTISEPNSEPADHTQVVLRKTGKQYELDRIWLAGRSQGYEFLAASDHP